MAKTQLTSEEIGSVQRNDFDVTTSGQAVITKVIAGTNVTISSTGVNAGTGDVTVNSNAPTTDSIGSVPNAAGLSISGNVITLQPASASFGGVVTTGTQTFAGAKTFSSSVSAASLAATGLANGTVPYISSSGLLTSSSLGFTYSTVGSGGLNIGGAAGISTATPAYINMGGTYSSTANASPKFQIYNDGTVVFGFGVSTGQFEYQIPSGYSHVFYAGTAAAFTVSNDYILGYKPTVIHGEAYNLYNLSATNMTLGSWTGVRFGVTGYQNRYGLFTGTDDSTGHVWLQSGRTDTAIAYNLSLQASGGGVVIGGVGSTLTSGYLLDVKGGINANGAVSFSGALMPNNTAGSSGQYLKSNGSSSVPTWASLPAALSMAAIGSVSNANGATISGSTLTLQPASPTYGGVVTTGTQYFGGAKYFDSIATDNAANISGDLYVGGNANFDGFVTLQNSLSLTGDHGYTGQVLTSQGTGTPPIWTNMLSGVYTPYVNILSDATSVTPYECRYMQVGSVVTVSGQLDIASTGHGLRFSIEMGLPITTSFDATNQAGGTGANYDYDYSGNAILAARISAIPYTTLVLFEASPNGGSNAYSFHFTYSVI